MAIEATPKIRAAYIAKRKANVLCCSAFRKSSAISCTSATYSSSPPEIQSKTPAWVGGYIYRYGMATEGYLLANHCDGGIRIIRKKLKKQLQYYQYTRYTAYR